MASINGPGLMRYLELYKAALRGDWNAAERLFGENDLIRAVISCYGETALHVAVSTGKSNYFVNRLVELMPRDTLTLLKDRFGNTALHLAAKVGNTQAARDLVIINENLLYIPNNEDELPITTAAVRSQKETLQYLISAMRTRPNVNNNPFEGDSGIIMFMNVISAEFFDVALYLVENYPNLAAGLHTIHLSAMSGLSAMSVMSSVFPSGERFSWRQKMMYRCLPPKQPERQAAPPAAPVAGDIENASCGALVYRMYTSSFQIISGGKYHMARKLVRMLWKVIENLVPEVKRLREKKAVHQQTLQLVRRLCQQMVTLPENDATAMFHISIIKAAKHGINEIVEEILEVYPLVVLCVDGDTKRDIFMLAASYRHENVFNLIYNMSDYKYTFFDRFDKDNNNLMHICGKLAPPDRLNIVPGAALQMQRESQWFKEAVKYVSHYRRTWKNNEDQLPHLLFTKEHEKLKVEGEKWMKETANACTIAAALIATVVFAAIFTVPGGVASDTGIPIFSDEPSFFCFIISDTVSLFTSITSLLLFLSILTSRYAEEDFLYVLPKRLSIGLLSLFVSITFMMVAFSATLYLLFRRKVSWFLIPMAVFACLPVTSFVLLQFPLLFDVVYSVYGPGVFGKKSDRLLY